MKLTLVYHVFSFPSENDYVIKKMQIVGSREPDKYRNKKIIILLKNKQNKKIMKNSTTHSDEK